jgi:hypothetical protein
MGRKPDLHGSLDFYFEVSQGDVENYTMVHHFGRNAAVGTTYVPITDDGIYRTLQPVSAIALRIKAGGDANDAAAGTGARKITLEGLDANGDIVTEEITTNGISVSSPTTATFIRLYDAYVSESGTYATSTVGSHSGDITIEDTDDNEWAVIDSTDFPRSQSEIGAYSIPEGFDGYFLEAEIFTDSTKTTDLIFFKREGILDASPPYESMRILFEERISGGESSWKPTAPIKLTGPADIGFLAKVDTNPAEVDVDFELMLVPKGQGK